MIHLHVVTVKARAGTIWLAGTEAGVMRLGFGKAPETRVPAALEKNGVLRIRRSPGPLLDAVRSLRSYLAGEIGTPEGRLDLGGMTGFGRRVLDVVRKIPPGKVFTYAQLARQAGTPRGARAAGQALAANPIPLRLS